MSAKKGVAILISNKVGIMTWSIIKERDRKGQLAKKT